MKGDNKTHGLIEPSTQAQHPSILEKLFGSVLSDNLCDSLDLVEVLSTTFDTFLYMLTCSSVLSNIKLIIGSLWMQMKRAVHDQAWGRFINGSARARPFINEPSLSSKIRLVC